VVMRATGIMSPPVLAFVDRYIEPAVGTIMISTWVPLTGGRHGQHIDKNLGALRPVGLVHGIVHRRGPSGSIPSCPLLLRDGGGWPRCSDDYGHQPASGQQQAPFPIRNRSETGRPRRLRGVHRHDPATGAQGVQAAVGGDPVQPGADRRALLETGQPAPGRQQRLLKRVLGVLGGAKNPVAMDLQLVLIGVHQLPERVLVPGPGPGLSSPPSRCVPSTRSVPSPRSPVLTPPATKTGRSAPGLVEQLTSRELRPTALRPFGLGPHAACLRNGSGVELSEDCVMR
jgi:hypothetical protein